MIRFGVITIQYCSYDALRTEDTSNCLKTFRISNIPGSKDSISHLGGYPLKSRGTSLLSKCLRDLKTAFRCGEGDFFCRQEGRWRFPFFGTGKEEAQSVCVCVCVCVHINRSGRPGKIHSMAGGEQKTNLLTYCKRLIF